MSANASDTFSVTELCLSNTFRVTEFCFSNMNAQHTLQMTCTPSSCLILPQLEDACKQRTKNINTHTSHKHTPDHMHSFVAPHPTTAAQLEATTKQPPTATHTSTLQMAFIPSSPLILQLEPTYYQEHQHKHTHAQARHSFLRHASS